MNAAPCLDTLVVYAKLHSAASQNNAIITWELSDKFHLNSCRSIITLDVVHKMHVRYTRQRLEFQVECDMRDAHSDFAEESGLLGCYTVPTDNYRCFEEM